MRIVFLVGNYVPRCSAVGNCVKNLAHVLENSHDIFIVCQKQNEATKCIDTFGRQIIIRIETRSQQLQRFSERIKSTFGAKIVGFAAKSGRFLRMMLPKGAVDHALVGRYVEALNGLTLDPDMIVPVCCPFESVLASVEYKKNHPGVRLVPFLFDQYADSKTLCRKKWIAKIKRKANLRQEREMLWWSDMVLNITWADHVAACHPEFVDKLRHVEHPLLVDPGIGKKKKTSGLLVYAGALDETIRNPAYTLNLLSVALGSGSDVCKIDFYVPQSDKFSEYFKDVSEAITLNEAVASAEVPNILSSADWLLSIGNRTFDQKISKLYEYMSLGKPIIHIASGDDDPAVTELSRYPLSLCLKQSAPFDGNVSTLIRFAKQTKGRHVPFEIVSSLYEAESPSFVASILTGGGGDSYLRG